MIGLYVSHAKEKQCLKPCPHCRRKVRLSHKSETVTENGETTATVALFCDSVDKA